MQIEILYFGRLREISGHRQETLNRPQGDTLSSIISILAEKYGGEFKKRIDDSDRYSILINGRHYLTIAADRPKLKDGDQVVFMPVTMGG